MVTFITAEVVVMLVMEMLLGMSHPLGVNT